MLSARAGSAFSQGYAILLPPLSLDRRLQKIPIRIWFAQKSYTYKVEDTFK